MKTILTPGNSQFPYVIALRGFLYSRLEAGRDLSQELQNSHDQNLILRGDLVVDLLEDSQQVEHLVEHGGDLEVLAPTIPVPGVEEVPVVVTGLDESPAPVVPEPVAEPVVVPVVEPVVVPVVEPAPEPVVEPVVEPVPEPAPAVPEPAPAAPEPVVEPVAEPVAEPAPAAPEPAAPLDTPVDPKA